MAGDLRLIPAIMGWTVEGDACGYTFYTNYRGKIVFYPRAPPKTAATPNQNTLRNRMKQAAFLWQGMTEEQKALWKSATKKARLKVQAYHLFTAAILTSDWTPIKTIERNTGITLPQPGNPNVH